MTKTVREQWKHPNWQAFVAISRSPEQEQERMVLVPDNIKRRVESHMVTVKQIRNEEEMRKRREEDERKK